jgi:ATP/maltotriose-dependent transcriptional regulator MalT
VLRLIAREDSNRAIARQLFISEATVKTHLAHIYEKLGVKQRTAAVVEALRRGLLSIET